MPTTTIIKPLRVLKVKRLHADAILPKYQTPGSACFDLHALTEQSRVVSFSSIFRTGFAVEVPPGYVMKVFSRSGHGFNNDVRLANCVGVIDSDYRGELMVKLTADGLAFVVEPGDRIAQAMLVPVEQWALTEVDELCETVRGAGGFGSTGTA